MTETLHVDFETRSRVDLKKCGADVYARDPSTRVICMAWAFDDEPVQLIVPQVCVSTPELDRVFCHIMDGKRVYAHNAPFELTIWNNVMVPKFGWGPLQPEQTYCTMAMAYAMSLPGNLDGASAAVGLSQQKDMKGHRVMLQLSQPRKVHDDGSVTWYTPEDAPEKYETLYEYCKQDVEVERALHHRLMELSASERDMWLLDHHINQRGIHIDMPAVEKAIEVVESEKKRLDGEMKQVTNNAVSTCTAVGQLADWLKWHDVQCESVDKATLVDLLVRDDLQGNLKPQCRRAIELRQEAGKSSTAKLQAMVNGANEDNRVRSTMQFHAAGTGRWGGRRVQAQNLPRPDMPQDEIEQVLDRLHAGSITAEEINIFYGAPMTVISNCVRGFICAPEGKVLMQADFANIEGRVLAWLADEQWKLEAFYGFDRGELPDMYVQSYSRSFGVSMDQVTKDQRQIGKVQELALGYQGGVGAFNSMARVYGIEIEDERADQIKVAWRQAHPKTQQFWYALEDAAMRAVQHPGTQTQAGRIKFLVNGSFLWCRLPSGRVLCYPYPAIEKTATPWGSDKFGLTYRSVTSTTHKWEKQKTYGGKIAENVTQASARDVLADAMKRLDRHGFHIVFHVHDEIVCEEKANDFDHDYMCSIMSDVPEWAEGLPIAVEGWQGQRYRK